MTYKSRAVLCGLVGLSIFGHTDRHVFEKQRPQFKHALLQAIRARFP